MRTIIMLCVCLALCQCRKKKQYNEEIKDCDPIGNYYENGNHYISRDMITDEGGLDYKKLFENYYERKKSPCDPGKGLITR